MRALLGDVLYGLRGLLARPAFTAAVVLVLAVGIGANTAIFSVVDAVVLKPLPYRDPERLVMLWETDVAKGLDHELLSPVSFLDYRGLTEIFADAAAWWHPEINLTDGKGDPIRAAAVEVTSNFFSVLGVEPQLGHAFTAPAGELHGDQPEIVISDRFWHSRYGADGTVLGRPIRLNGEPYTVIGVMPPGFNFPGETDVWQHLGWNPVSFSRYARFMEVVARLQPGVDRERVTVALAVLAGRLATEFPASSTGRGARAVPLVDEVVGETGPRLLVLLAAVGMLLLLMAANVGNLLLARASSREREVAIRAALGASRGRLVRQLLTESLLLGLVGAAFGLGVAWAGVKLLVAAPPIDVPRLSEVAIDGRVLGFGLTITLLAVLLFGLAPALRLSATDLHGTLKEGGRATGSGRAGRHARAALVVVEIAVAVVLMVGSGLLVRSFLELLEQHPGFAAQGAVTTSLQLPGPTYEARASYDWRRVSGFYEELLERLDAHPAITAAGVTNFLPLEPAWRIEYALADRPEVAPGDEPEAQYVTVSAGYFEAMGIPLLSGRTFSRRDTADSPPTVVVNAELARRAWPGATAVGKVLTSGTRGIGQLGRLLKEERDYEVVGVVGDVKNTALENGVEPAVYFVQTQFPYRSIHLVARGQGEPARLAALVRAEVRRLDAGLALTEVRTLDSLLADSRAQRRFVMLLLAALASLAVLLAAIGIYGVLSFAVAERRGELGVRIALGATPGRVRRLVLREGMLLAALGLAAGSLAAFGMARLMASLLYGIEAGDVVAFTAAAAVVVTVAFAACEVPARRASRVDPLEMLR